MFSSLLPDADAIDLWATQRLAESELPRLVRRLIATTTDPTWIDMGAGTAVRFPGWDGVLKVPTGNMWVPTGDSYWEIGTGGDPDGKADRDYSKRTKATPEAVRLASKFVFVSAKNWQGRDSWQARKRALGEWADVVAIDAQRLEAWLERSPIVHLWLSEKMNSAIVGARSLEDWWIEWSDCYPHSLPPKLLLVGRESEAVDLMRWVDADASERAIEGDTQDEVIAFAAAALQSGEADVDTRLMRSVVVRTPDAWRQVIRVSQPLILIPEFGDEGLWVGQAIRNGHHVIVPAGPDDPVVANVKLAALQDDDVIAGLEEMGLEPRRAREVVEAAGGSLRQLRRSLSRVEEFRQPAWSRGEASRTLVPAVLVQSWDAASEGDRTILSRLAGRDYASFEDDLVELAEGTDPPVRRRGTVWVLAARDDAWRIVLPAVTADDWTRFVEAAAEALGAPDPAWELSPDKRWMAAVYDKVPAHSERVRRGLANSVAMLAGWRFARDLPNGRSGPELADLVVTRLLDSINEDSTGGRWAALGTQLPSVAEASPGRYLVAVRGALEGLEPIFPRLMADSEAGGIFGRASHAGILWGLEGLAWSPEHLEEVAKVLARWSAIDPGGRSGNRPATSLREIFLPWHPQTSATIGQRIEALAAVREGEPAASWSLILSLMPKAGGDIGGNTHRPRWRAWTPAADVNVTLADYWEFVRAALGWLLEDAGEDGERWADLVDLYDVVPEELGNEIVDALGRVDPQVLSSDGREAVAAKLRQSIDRHRAYSDAAWSLSPDRIARLEPEAQRFAPDDPVARDRWLFEAHPDTASIAGKDYKRYDSALTERRGISVTEMIESGGWESIEQLVESVEEPWTVGWTLGQLSSVDEESVLGWADGPARSRRNALRGFIGAKTRRVGWVWADETIRKRGRAWSIEQTAEAVIAASDRAEGWTLAAELGPEVERAFWTNYAGYPRDEDVWEAAAKLLEFGRPIEALERIGWEADKAAERFNADLAYTALIAGTKAPADSPQHAVSSLQHNLSSILDALDAAGLDPDKVAQLEWYYFPLLEHSDQPAKRLGGLMARDPRFFVEVVSAVWLGESETAAPADARIQGVASQAYRLLRVWKVPPGTTDQETLDPAALRAWILAARRLLSEADRAQVGDAQIGHVLWWAPAGSDGLRPHDAVRDLIEELANENLESGFHTEAFNSRGVGFRSLEGGAEEREIAARYRATEARLVARWPRTAAIYSSLAASYEAMAVRADDAAALRADDSGDW